MAEVLWLILGMITGGIFILEIYLIIKLYVGKKTC